MTYKQSIANEIMELYKNAPKDKTTEYYLEHFNQQDVADTVNYLATTNPKKIQETDVYYDGKAPIIIMK